MKRLALIIAVLICVCANSAGAGVYNNSGTTGEDSIAIVFQVLDSVGSATALAAGDSVYLVVFYPSGSVCFRDSMAHNNSRITLADWEDYNRGEVYTFREAVANIDGAGLNGTYKYLLEVEDRTSANLTTSWWGEFQLVTHDNYAAMLDSILQALDYTNNTNEVVRGATSTVDATVLGGVDVTSFDGNPVTIVATVPSVNVSNMSANTVTASAIAADAIGASEIAADAITASELGGTAADEIRDSVWKSYMTDYVGTAGQIVDTIEYIAGAVDAIRDSTDEMAATGSGITAAQMGTIADSVWGTGHSADRRLTSLDEDDVTIDLNGTAVGSVVGSVGSVAGLADTMRDVIGDTLNATSGKVYVALVDGLADTVRDVIGDTLNATSGKVYVAIVDGLGDTLRDVVGDTFNVVSGKVLTDAGDTIRAHAPHDDNFGGSGGGGNWGDTLKTLAHRTDSLMRRSRPDSVRAVMAKNVTDSTRDVVGDSLSGTKLAVSEIQAFFGACDECYYRLFPEGGTANKDSAIVIDGSINTSDSLLGKIIYLHGTNNAVYDTAFFYTRPWW